MLLTEFEFSKLAVTLLFVAIFLIGIGLTSLLVVLPLRSKLLQTEFNLTKAYGQYRDLHSTNYIVPKYQELTREKEIRDMTNKLLSQITRMARDKVLGFPVDEKPELDSTPVPAQVLDDISLCIKALELRCCEHSSTHRAGVLWTVCNDCGEKWADDEDKPVVSQPAYLTRLKDWLEEEGAKHG